MAGSIQGDSPNMQTNHIAVLVRDLEKVTRTLPSFCVLHEQEDQPADGSTEQHVDIGSEGWPPLLLIQPVAKGPFLSAMHKRGPGLHHLGCITTDLDAAVRQAAEHRLLLHPISLSTYARGFVWLCRPGVPFLIELMRAPAERAPLLPCRLHLPQHVAVPDYVRTVSSNLVIENAPDSHLAIVCGDRHVAIDLGGA